MYSIEYWKYKRQFTEHVFNYVNCLGGNFTYIEVKTFCDVGFFDGSTNDDLVLLKNAYERARSELAALKNI